MNNYNAMDDSVVTVALRHDNNTLKFDRRRDSASYVIENGRTKSVSYKSNFQSLNYGTFIVQCYKFTSVGFWIDRHLNIVLRYIVITVSPWRGVQYIYYFLTIFVWKHTKQNKRIRFVTNDKKKYPPVNSDDMLIDNCRWYNNANRRKTRMKNVQ